ncbi:hypothetical protein BDF20DRAFT_886912 [Mycotypha africana]|uniref:uncharacterized protein n=1 Tax=Mycotypha africana TaxID=64632 RepID=UPI0023002290|nr:uncharacterized protein BDF20DRAFT_886912 [Mycotypha africana]KAI8971870.1 hypothetical protein BDF20DRAFT_886912 [Mycotypha africana]
MDLSNLLNNQRDESLTLADIQRLYTNHNAAETLDKIRSVTIYEYPTDTAGTFTYFDSFIQLILSCNAHADNNALSTKTIIVDALRNCISGLMRKHKLSWLLEAPQFFASKTWHDLQDNTTILVYLYGLVLAALLNNPDLQCSSTNVTPAEVENLIQGLLSFSLSNSPEIIAHLWLNCCSTFDEAETNTVLNTTITIRAFMKNMERNLQSHRVSEQVIYEMFKIIQTSDISVLNTKIEQELGNALARPAFTKDDIVVGYMCLDNICRTQANNYVHIARLYQQYKNAIGLKKELKGSLSNPLLSVDLLANTPSDKYAQTEAIRQGVKLWIQQMSTLTPQTFDQFLKMAIQQHYPTERKTVLDLVLADWTLRDRFDRHLPLVLDTIAAQMEGNALNKPQDFPHNTKKKNRRNNKFKNKNDDSASSVPMTTSKYNRRNAPYYAFTQLFDIPDEQEYHQQAQKRQLEEGPEGELALFDTALSYQIRSGALIDLSQFTGSSDIQLMNGCCKLLQRMTISGAKHSQIKNWTIDCLESANSDIIRNYTEWLVFNLERSIADISDGKQVTQPSVLRDFMRALLKTCSAFASDIVPIILESFSEENLKWLLQQQQEPTTIKIILNYFDDGPQASKDAVVTKLLKTKSKAYTDCLLSFLKEHMPGTDPKQPRSRAWFRNHFLGNILNLAGQDVKNGNSVASRIFRQLFKTRNDFEWYFSTPLVPSSQFTFKSVSLSTSHEIYSIMHSGIAFLFQEMVQLLDNSKKQNLIDTWMELWTVKSGDDCYKFTVPVSWILQCTGFYDQAPVLVKQMLKQLVTIGFQQEENIDLEHDLILRSATDRKFLYRIMDLVLLSDTPDPDSLFELILSTASQQANFEQMINTIIHTMIELSEELELEMLTNNIPLINAKLTRLKSGNYEVQKKKRKITQRRLRVIMRKHNEELEKYLQDINQYNNSMKALTTLAQRIFNFLLRLLNSASSPSIIDSTDSIFQLKHQFQQQLLMTPLFYEPLVKLAKLLREPRDLQEDIQTVIELSSEFMKKQADKELYEACQKLLMNQ